MVPFAKSLRMKMTETKTVCYFNATALRCLTGFIKLSV